ncbi:phosphate transport regulator [Actinomyces radicidentis]|uniref:Phosphate transport regulator n=1 Tax=Actinomyces radicidentis TaxID=111015 RepID=A0A109W3C0_ACTRD|nr:phosphate transport regulator [Actinomyces radicidentis]
MAARLEKSCALIARVAAADLNDRPELREQLHAVESEADEIHLGFQRLVADTFVTPVDREDLRRIGGLLDDCIDYVDEAGDAVVLYQVGALPPACTRQVEILQRCAELTSAALPSLRAASSLREYWVEINSLENEADLVYRAAIAELFATETDAIRLVKVKEVLERLEAAADAFELLAEGVELLAMREG